MMLPNTTAFSVWPSTGCALPQQVQQDDAAGGERQRQRHVEHRQLAGAHARLGQRLDVVRDRLDAGVGAAALRVGAAGTATTAPTQPMSLRELAASPPSSSGDQRRQARGMARAMPYTISTRWVTTKPRKIGSRILIDSFMPRRLSTISSTDDQRSSVPELARLEAERQQAEQRIDAARDRDRDGQHVVDDQRARRRRAPARGRSGWSRRDSRRRPVGNSSITWL